MKSAKSRSTPPSGNSARRDESRNPAKDDDAARNPANISYPPPLKPHPKLFRWMAIGFAFWIAALLLMYFTTVFNQRHPTPPASPIISPANSR